LTENLAALVSDNVGDNSDNVLFSTEDEIMEILLEKLVMSGNSLSKPVYESHEPVGTVLKEEIGLSFTSMKMMTQ